MRVIKCWLLVLLFAATPGGSAALAQQVYAGACEPSGAVTFPEASFAESFIVADDEDNVLRAYSAEGGDPQTLDADGLYADFDPEPSDKIDFEAGTWMKGKIYWIGSHSRGGNGKLREDSWQFFSTEALEPDGAIKLRASPAFSLHTLLGAFSDLDPLFAETIDLGDEDDNDLAPDEGGFNIEGLTAAADGSSMLIGLRSPLTEVGEAMIVRFANPEESLAGAEPVLDPPISLDLGGRGVRSIEYSAAANAYIIVAGAVGGDEPFELYRWRQGEDAIPIPGSADAIAAHPDFTPEAMIVNPAGTEVLLLSDDGDRCDEEEPEFRGIVLGID